MAARKKMPIAPSSHGSETDSFRGHRNLTLTYRQYPRVLFDSLRNSLYLAYVIGGKMTFHGGAPMRKLRAAGAVGVLVMVGTLTGCCGGGKTTVESKTPVNVQTKTTGEQLMDLKKAHESGAINEKEYNKMKQDIIEKSGNK